ncbi:B12-binding domain-containing radical SAM protein [Saccharothrix obliqua]|uniref:B12-binding domain-containing radical SAM protein n=1 Tax=Saccharothrix obliqua TaxID=2861747 RepID=UPI001C5DDE48|nr:cobalamin-dependent protein [Saccharothrix obliqua]MBW4720411.1 cobalamin-dependent protein [Saccharothrix obliqua]
MSPGTTVVPEVWLADLTYTQQSISAESMPYAVACLATYAADTSPDLKFRLFKYPERLAEALEAETPRVLGFSHYVWNSELSLAFARAVRAARPDVVIVFGGPHYSLVVPEREQFLREHPEIDYYVVGEGEQGFAELLVELTEAGFDRDAVHGKVRSVNSIAPDGTAHMDFSRPRMADMESIPPPYLSGLLDEFFDGKLVPTLQTNRGCPFKCTFCVEGEKYYQKVAMNPLEAVERQLHHIGSRMRDLIAEGGRNELLLTDSNFGMYPQDEQICDIIAECQDRYGWPRYINATTGKNKRDRVLRAIEKTRGAIQLTGSVQSMDPGVLENIQRTNINADTLVQQALAAKQAGAGSYSEIILGLPGDSRAAHLASIRKLLDAGFDSLTMFQLSLLPGSELSTPANRERFAMRTKYRVIPRSFGSYRVLGQVVAAAEVDEVCVGLDTLTFDEYLECRIYNCYVSLLHNHSPFAAIEKFLQSKGRSIADWIDAAIALPRPADLDRAMELFTRETIGQLHDDRDELMEYVKQPETMARYLSGELGNNEMYTYRAYALMYGWPGLVEIAFSALDKVFEDDPLSAEEHAFLADLREFVSASGRGVFELDSPTAVHATLSHDIARYASDPESTPADCVLATPQRVAFRLTRDQRDLLSGYAKTLGLDERGIGRALTKSRLYHFLREAVPETSADTAPARMAVR